MMSRMQQEMLTGRLPKEGDGQQVTFHEVPIGGSFYLKGCYYTKQRSDQHGKNAIKAGSKKADYGFKNSDPVYVTK